MKTCERCGARFECGAEAGKERCWCADLPPVLPPDPSKSCLCPECLKELVRKLGPGQAGG